jgi:hypothetical protein
MHSARIAKKKIDIKWYTLNPSSKYIIPPSRSFSRSLSSKIDWHLSGASLNPAQIALRTAYGSS